MLLPKYFGKIAINISPHIIDSSNEIIKTVASNANPFVFHKICVQGLAISNNGR